MSVHEGMSGSLLYLLKFLCAFEMLFVWGICDHKSMAIGKRYIIFWVTHVSMLG